MPTQETILQTMFRGPLYFLLDCLLRHRTQKGTVAVVLRTSSFSFVGLRFHGFFLFSALCASFHSYIFLSFILDLKPNELGPTQFKASITLGGRGTVWCWGAYLSSDNFEVSWYRLGVYLSSVKYWEFAVPLCHDLVESWWYFHLNLVQLTLMSPRCG